MEEDGYSQQPQRIMQPSLYALPKEMIELLLDATAVIERIRHDLQGEVLITGETTYIQEWKPIGERSMNDMGVRAVVKILNMYVNPESALTQLTNGEIYKTVLNLDYNINALFYSRGKEFEMSPNTKTIVKDGICDIVFFALKKSLNGKQMESLLKSWTVDEQRYPDMKKGGWKEAIIGLSPLKGK